MHALKNAKIHRVGKKYARAGLQQPAAAQEDLARVSAECVCARVQQYRKNRAKIGAPRDRNPGPPGFVLEGGTTGLG